MSQSPSFSLHRMGSTGYPGQGQRTHYSLEFVQIVGELRLGGGLTGGNRDLSSKDVDSMAGTPWLSACPIMPPALIPPSLLEPGWDQRKEVCNTHPLCEPGLLWLSAGGARRPQTGLCALCLCSN